MVWWWHAAGEGHHCISNGDVCVLTGCSARPWYSWWLRCECWMHTPGISRLGTSLNTWNQRVCLLIWTAVAVSQSSSTNSCLNQSCHIPQTKLGMLDHYIDRSLAAVRARAAKWEESGSLSFNISLIVYFDTTLVILINLRLYCNPRSCYKNEWGQEVTRTTGIYMCKYKYSNTSKVKNVYNEFLPKICSSVKGQQSHQFWLVK
jgi:hypothetical protein